MADSKNKENNEVVASPSGVPELSEEQKRRIEDNMNLEVEDEEPVSDATELDEEKAEPKDGEGEAEESKDPDESAKPDGPDQPEEPAEAETKPETEQPAESVPEQKRPNFYWRHKRWTLPLTMLVVLGAVAGVPQSRDFVAAYVITEPVSVTVKDTSTSKPVSSADVDIAGQTGKTDKDGKVTIDAVKYGHREVKVTKKYYKDATSPVYVAFSKSGRDVEVKLQATGRQVPVSVKNKITGKPLADVTLQSVGTEVKTDKDGKAVIVLPADRPDLPVTLTNGGYNQLEARIKVTDQEVKDNNFAMVPAGKVYFLSKASGKIDVVKTDLDGSSRAIVVQGTGKEEEANTVLLASRDWKYLALYSKRDSGLPKIFLVDTSNDKLTEMDSGDAKFTLVGWSGHDFVYGVERNKVNAWDANHQAVKSYDAESRQITTLDQTASEKGDMEGKVVYQAFSDFYLQGDKLIYSIQWNSHTGDYFTGQPSNKSITLRQVIIGTTGKKDIKAFEAGKYYSIQALPYEANGIYYALYGTGSDGKYEFYQFEDGKVEPAKIEDDDFFSKPYPTFLASPDSKRTFWSEQRDGRPNFFVGDEAGENGKSVGVFDDSAVYGWYGNDYLLMSKKGSELYVLPAEGGTPLKVSDYHKPNVSYRGYGGGYGGL